uniref:EF-hand domain-containing protein n=1 Tax=Takifugu rubripes TaxID=31033 RepID=A0A674NBK9_TAKRU
MADKSEQTILTAMDFLKETFFKYADTDDDKGTMSKKELADLLRNQLDEVPHYFKKMDEDGDSKITFKEYMHYLTDLYECLPSCLLLPFCFLLAVQFQVRWSCSPGAPQSPHQSIIHTRWFAVQPSGTAWINISSLELIVDQPPRRLFVPPSLTRPEFAHRSLQITVA